MGTKTKLHFTRVKAKDDPAFFDTQTDIRLMFPSVIKTAVMSLQDQHAGNQKLAKDFNYIHNCICIFQVRLAEDSAPLDEQVHAFLAAISKCDAAALSMLYARAFMLFLALYSLFCRRDAKVDKKQLATMLGFLQIVPLKGLISQETYDKVRTEFLEKAPADLQDVHCPMGGHIICEETEQVFNGIKNIVQMFFSASGDRSWEGLSSACDEAFCDPDKHKDDMQMLALALAYPDYDHPSLTAEMEVTTNEPL